jgi:hypothetical protein
MPDLVSLIYSTPFMLKLICSLFLIILFNRLTKNLIISTIPSILVLAFWSGHAPLAVLQIAWERFSSLHNILLILIILQVIWLSLQMEQSGIMKDLVDTVQSRLKQKAALAVLPALIGLLPMPGGALFSAPMVDDLDKTKTISPLLKTKINYWFRHIWEYFLPLYPGVLLAIDLTRLHVWQFILLQLPMSLLFLLSGYFFLLRPLKVAAEPEDKRAKSSLAKLLLLILPILIVLGLDAIISLLFPALAELSSFIPMSIGLVISQVILQIQRPLPLKAFKKVFLSPKTIEMAALIVLVRIYAAFIEARLPDGLFLMEHVREELFQAQIPLVLIVMLITFLSGLTTGVAVGFVGASFPIVINLLGNNPAFTELLAFTLLAYVFGHIGMMISPVHSCHLVTNQYFKTSLIKSTIQIIQPASMVLVGSVFVFIIIRYIM